MLLQTARSATAGDGPSRQQQQRLADDLADNTGASLATLEGRLRTFNNGGWPVSFIAAEEMAAAGFFSLRRGDDSAQCFCCGVVVNSWEPGDEPLTEHHRWSPRCPFLAAKTRGCADAVSYDSCSPFDAPQPQSQLQPQSPPQPTPTATPVHTTKAAWSYYRTREARLASFKEWPPAIPVKPAELSDAGFFYSGVGDRTICYYCGRGLRDWEPGDDPWVEHELWFPGCSHVLLHRGHEFVKEVAAKREAMIAAKKNPREATSVAPASAESSEAGRGGETRVDQSGRTQNGPTDENRLCKICFENEMGVVFLPCGHIVACVDCALAVSECPMCRQPFQNTARVYLP